jgi:hypothetical protein
MDNRDGERMTDILDRIRARAARKPEIPISIPEWDLEAFIRPPSAGKMASLRKINNPAHICVHVIINGVVDADGKQVFTDDAETLAALVDQPHALIDRVSTQIVMADSDSEAAKDFLAAARTSSSASR